MNRTKLIHEAAAVLGELTAARKHLAQGRPIDLGGLDMRVAAVSEATVALPRGEAQELLPLLDDIGRALDSLGDALKQSDPAHA
jgi:hypothetical protein